ncbi:MAG: hypothetical protein ACYTHK_14160 [Planctomycetota bacterium]|jgi:hypothetical protein
MEDLHGYGFATLGPREIDRSHPASSQSSKQTVRADPLRSGAALLETPMQAERFPDLACTTGELASDPFVVDGESRLEALEAGEQGGFYVRFHLA